MYNGCKTDFTAVLIHAIANKVMVALGEGGKACMDRYWHGKLQVIICGG